MNTSDGVVDGWSLPWPRNSLMGVVTQGYLTADEVLDIVNEHARERLLQPGSRPRSLGEQ